MTNTYLILTKAKSRNQYLPNLKKADEIVLE